MTQASQFTLVHEAEYAHVYRCNHCQAEIKQTPRATDTLSQHVCVTQAEAELPANISELSRLLSEYSNAAFDCGAYDFESEESYELVVNRWMAAQRKVEAYIQAARPADEVATLREQNIRVIRDNEFLIEKADKDDKEMESLRSQLSAAREIISELVASGVEFSDPRIKYVTVQIGRADIAQAKAWLAQTEGGTSRFQ